MSAEATGCLLLFSLFCSALAYSRPRQLIEPPPLLHNNDVDDPILTPLFNLLKSYNRPSSPVISQNIDKPEMTTTHPNSILSSFNLNPFFAHPTTTTAPQSNWLRSLIEPFRQEFQRNSVSDLHLRGQNIRRAPVPSTTFVPPTTTITLQTPLTNLLEILGLNAKPRDEVQVGRDRTISVLGMPVGRRDGLMLSPLKGLSLGEQKMFGPIAVNDKYNVNWDFLNILQ
ncbi:hypothetical protein M3Y95_00017600 [Aphelenchoides besseyi]|nr:hypothetical protein M3Y95_00017600 [Aphelenchoides besseyi]